MGGLEFLQRLSYVRYRIKLMSFTKSVPIHNGTRRLKYEKSKLST